MNGYFDIPSDTRLAGPEPSKTTEEQHWSDLLDVAEENIRFANSYRSDRDTPYQQAVQKCTAIEYAIQYLERAKAQLQPPPVPRRMTYMEISADGFRPYWVATKGFAAFFCHADRIEIESVTVDGQEVQALPEAV